MSNPRRGPEERRVRLTPRDLEIIRAVCRHGAMTSKQIRFLFFQRGGHLASRQAACRRLKALTESGYLGRLRLPTPFGSGPYVYLPVVGSQVALESDELALAKQSKRERLRSATAIAHRLEIVDFYVALTFSLRQRDGSMLAWLTERQAHCDLEALSRSKPFTPDAFCLWQVDDKEGAFFLEWDRGTESMTRLADKLNRYEVYYRGSVYRDHLGVTGLRPRVLFILPGERRLRKFVSWLSRRLSAGKWPSLPTILGATAEAALKAPLGKSWYRPGTHTEMSITD